jgi:RND family efflux transporter MFP subunit
MTRAPRTALLLTVLAAVAGCGGGGETANGTAADSTVIVTAENVVVVDSARIETGPSLSGSLQPERGATVRAEISGPVLRVGAERGQSVRAGTLIVHIDDVALRDAFLSARSAFSTAEQSATIARRNAERAQTLFQAGAIAERQLEDARLAAETSAAQLTDARARLVLAQNQLAKASVRAPFAGVISERFVNVGDVVQPGSDLFTIVDPGSMRLEASVPAGELARVRVGAPVEFVVTGYAGRVFEGRVSRVNPTVDPGTRQVTVYVSIPNSEGRLVGGLYAEGRVATESSTGLVVPLDAVDFNATPNTVLRIRASRVEHVNVQVGLRDDYLERVQIVSGLMRGDTVLLGAARGITPGTPVRIQAFETSRNGRR